MFNTRGMKSHPTAIQGIKCTCGQKALCLSFLEPLPWSPKALRTMRQLFRQRSDREAQCSALTGDLAYNGDSLVEAWGGFSLGAVEGAGRAKVRRFKQYKKMEVD